ncbi:hypothetical protein AVEN_130972-1 [Araneus ventricosus]|uniref:Secreted protein n=1 Tax=Araneus ventricosus TaxID=182803 RepID=A0A4Y2Q195_ARAVE|nr:hypothetical protein AVEN_130972-1 [Araneus ventricosus]
MFPWSWSVVRRLLSQACLLQCDLFGEKPLSVRTSKASESMNGNLSTVLMDCCRLCMSSGKYATGRIQTETNPCYDLENKSHNRGGTSLTDLYWFVKFVTDWYVS